MGCKSEYQQYVDRELASGVRHDSLIFDMRIGQTREDFYTICWDLNKQKLITNGTGSNARYVIDKDSLGDQSEGKEVLFYGLFDENNVMQGMRLNYSYLAWAPWNKDKYADSLVVQLKKRYLEGYPGNDFLKIEIDANGKTIPAYVKIDGNRQILMYPKNKKDVMVKIEDLHYKLAKK
jgi:hypothetical protein